MLVLGVGTKLLPLEKGALKYDAGERMLAYRAFLADQALAGGMAPHALRAALGLSGPDAVEKFAASQPRVPAGSGRASGQWTSGSGEDTGQSLRDPRSWLHTIASADDPQQMKIVNDAARIAGLDNDQRSILRRYISGDDEISTCKQILETANEIKAGKIW